MKAAVTPSTGSPAPNNRRSTPTPASKRKTRFPTTTAVAGPILSGVGRGVPVPRRTRVVESGACACNRSGQSIATTAALKGITGLSPEVSFSYDLLRRRGRNTRRPRQGCATNLRTHQCSDGVGVTVDQRKRVIAQVIHDHRRGERLARTDRIHDDGSRRRRLVFVRFVEEQRAFRASRKRRKLQIVPVH